MAHPECDLCKCKTLLEKRDTFLKAVREDVAIFYCGECRQELRQSAVDNLAKAGFKNGSH